MALDPYASCPCGSGKKLKWCCGKIIPLLEKLESLIENNQEENAMKFLKKLEEPVDNSEFTSMYLEVLRARTLARFGKKEEAFSSIETTIEEYPRFGLPRITHADMLFSEEDIAEAADGYRDAMAHLPADAVDHQAETLMKLGMCHSLQGRPLAAWANWRCALKVKPSYEAAQEAMNRYITTNPLLPHRVRLGLSLKSPDELAVFNEDRRVKWDEALGKEIDWHIDDLVMAFEFLANDDAYDLAAWYNLAIANAWAGDNDKAIEAMEHYMKFEKDFDAAADAWDLAELFRFGVGAEDYSDHTLHVAVYEFDGIEAFTERFKDSMNVMVIKATDERLAFHWMDRELRAESAGVPILGSSRPKHLAELRISPGAIEFCASSDEKLQEARKQFESFMGNFVHHVGDYQYPGAIETLDMEPFLQPTFRSKSPDERRDDMMESIQRYFEEDWIHRPLRSLSGLAPIDAAQSDSFRKKVEGIIRFRERNFTRFAVHYDFDRLRNKLGLLKHRPGEGEVGEGNRDITSFSLAQLGALIPADLADEELLAAYRTAGSLDAQETVVKFGNAMIARDSLAHQIDMAAVHRRIVLHDLDRGKLNEARGAIDAALLYDERTGHGAKRNDLELLRFRVLAAEGKTQEAIEHVQRIVSTAPGDLALLSRAVETMLSAGNYDSAAEFAQRGLQQAEQQRDRDFQNQFRDYLKATQSRR